MPFRTSLFIFLSLVFFLKANIATPQSPQPKPKTDSSLIIYRYAAIDSLSWYSKPLLFDTLPQNAMRYDPLQSHDNFYAQTGNIGRASNPLFYSPNLTPGFDAGIHALDPYLFNVNNIQYFTIFYPMSRLKYVMGPKKELLFELLHNQNIGKLFSLGINVHALKSPGSYTNQLTNLFNFYTYLSFHTKSKRFYATAGGLSNLLKNGENGGIANDTAFEQNIETNRKLIPVQLGTARNSFKQVGFFLNQDFDLIRHQKIESDSSILKLRSFLPNKIRLTSYYDKQAWRYDDEGNQASFYPAFPKDSTVTRDIYTTESYHTRLFLYHTANKLFPVNYYAKLAYQTDKITDSVMNKTEEQSFAGLGMNTELILGIKAGIDWEQQLTGKYNKGDYKTQLLLEKYFGKGRYQTRIKLDYTIAATAPSMFQQHYHSNYFNWDNYFAKIHHSIYSVGLSCKGYELKFKHTEVQNLVVLLPVSSIPSQFQKKINVDEITFNKIFHIGHLVLDNEIRYQSISNTILLHLPSWTSRHALYFDLKLFNNALNMQPGFDIYIQSENYSDAYMPALRSFYLQYDKKLLPQTYVDFFVNLKLSRAIVFLSYKHLDGKFAAGQYYQTPGYPVPDAGFRFGVSWLLRDPPDSTQKTEGK
ncbi:MAG: putative porin [Bacteroidota bacterium]